MKRITALAAALTVMLCLFTACSGSTEKEPGESTATVYEWPEAEWFGSVPEFKKGSISYSHIDTASTVKITDADHDDFENYVKKLKSKNFAFYASDGKSEENTALKLDSTSSWTGSDGTVYIRVTYIDPASARFDDYKCSIVINSFSSKPSTWK